ncbi:ADP-ribosylglycohydrolase family protein [Nonomuraea endophytica]|uniref:ADP-ribosylglycohydrolase n=1 Tax=Nonomuraea endophytica TaxID=714136 RepID=A0A7W8A1I6_9ACTN|nr:ADP-ribosylglycohydrolase family protein [Nonomuraea endophytica]MBB5077851.1 ADP-ribosylglycohydrolase [Nonomuraea endophytica]
MSGDRIRGAFIGLAIGDAAGWPAARHRSALHAPWSRRLHRELDLFAEEHRITTLPVPFALNQPTAPLALGPSDDAEWLAWTVLTLRRPRAEAFRELAGREDVRARISVASALDNLAKGVEPPASGHDNPHFFDDAAAIRAVAFGAAGLDPTDDARVTNAGDGVLGARAVAAAIAAAVGGAPVSDAVEAALAVLPEDTAIGHNARLAVQAGRKAGEAFGAVPALDAALLDHVYSYAVGAAQTVPIALALAEASGGAVGPAVSAAACLAATADSAPALAGAITGACGGYGAIPEGWIAPVRTLAGCCLPELAGRDLLELTEGLT